MKQLIAIFASIAIGHAAYAADAKKEEPKKDVPAAKADAHKTDAHKTDAKADAKKEGDKPKIKPVGKDGKPVDDKKPAESTKK